MGADYIWRNNMDLGKELLKAIQIMVNRTLKNYKADCTYKTGIRGIDKKGYVITDRAGGERAVQCSIPPAYLAAAVLSFCPCTASRPGA